MRIKKFLSVISAAAVMIGCMPKVSTEAYDCDLFTYDAGSNYKYTKNSDGTLSITQYLGDESNVVIPSEIDGKTVTGIAEYAFSKCITVKTVKIPASIQTLGADLCDEGRTLPFKNTIFLESIEVEEENQYFSSVDGVLFNKDKTELLEYPREKKGSVYAVPSGVKTIADWAFYNNLNLSAVELPDSVSEIGMRIFENCFTLKYALIPKNVTSIGTTIFGGGGQAVTIYGYTGSYAEEYADRRGYTRFVSIDDSSKIQVKNGIVICVADDSTATLEGKCLDVEIVEEDEENITYDISLKDNNGKEVQTGGDVTLCITTPPERLDDIIWNFYRYESDGLYSRMKTNYSLYDGYSISTERLGMFIVTSDTLPTSIKGDADGNGDVNVTDALTALKAATKKITLSEAQNAAADVNGDGKVDVTDALTILKAATGKIEL